MSYIYLVRHGETSWNKQKRYQGHSDIALSKQGISKVHGLARGLKNIKAGDVYCSQLRRTEQTARILIGRRGLTPHPDARLNEMDFGQWEGKTAEELFALKDLAFAAFSKGRWVKPPGGESLQAVRRRVADFWQDCLKRHPGENVMIVSHAGPIKMILLEALKLPSKCLFQLHLDTASLTILRRYDRYFQLLSFNNTCAL